MKPKKHYVRKFLNKRDGMAAIEVSADDTYAYKENILALSDCHRTITLDFGFKDKKDKKEKLDKLANIITELQRLHEVMFGMDV